MTTDVVKGDPLDHGSNLERYSRALLNIIEDSGAEKLKLEAAQKATLNILTDFNDEKNRMADIQKAMLNIQEDSGAEKLKLEHTQKATLNILTDFNDERAKLTEVQKAVLNILEDFNVEKNKVERINREMVMEITERKQAEAALEVANKELEAFSYSVSHDLRAPLRSIDGFSQALLEDYIEKLDPQGKDYLQRVRAASQNMGQLIDDLLKLSRVIRSEMRYETVNLSELVHSIVTDLRKTQPERQLEFAIAPAWFVKGDARLLRIALENLLNNAWKFTSKRPNAKIEFGVMQKDGKTTFFVHDNGAGFDMAYANKLFVPFQRLHAPTEFPGTGIGLATVQRIINRHGGHIWAEGEVERGATFYFELHENE